MWPASKSEVAEQIVFEDFVSGTCDDFGLDDPQPAMCSLGARRPQPLEGISNYATRRHEQSVTIPRLRVGDVSHSSAVS